VSATNAESAVAAPTGLIDCQSHVSSEEFLSILEKRKESPYILREGENRILIVNEWRRRVPANLTDIEAKLAYMDRAGIAMSAISMNDPGPELFGKDSAAMAVLLNDFIAETVRNHPTRFFGLASLPFDTPDSMLKEFDRATGKLGLKGILLFSNLNGHFPDEEPYRPLFAEAERRGVPVLLHPARPVTLDVTKAYDMSTMIGMLFDTTIALLRLILSGVLEEHPNLKLVCPHVGGTLPYLIGRIDYQTLVMKRGTEHIRRAPSEYLKRIWYDSVTQIGLAIRYAVDFAGADRLLFASDHPWVQAQPIIDAIESANLTADQRAQVYAGNARALFKLD
jgi:predicted TIM-barrel fold metal-dependent hydrolase